MNKIDCKGIYKITNILNSKFYIGSTTKSFQRRWDQHKLLLKQNKHHSIKLQRAYNKYGPQYFKYEILEIIIDKNLILDREQWYLDNLTPYYNICKDVYSFMKHRKHSKKSLIKMKGKRPWNKGILRTDEEKSLMSERRREAYKNMDPIKKEQWRQKHIGKPGAMKGKHHSEEIKQKISFRQSFHSDCVLCLNNNIIYPSQLCAAKALNIRQGHICENLKGTRPHVKGFQFEYYAVEVGTRE